MDLISSHKRVTTTTWSNETLNVIHADVACFCEVDAQHLLIISCVPRAEISHCN